MNEMFHNPDNYQCRLCGSEEGDVFLSDCRGLFGDIYDLVICKECSFISIHPIPADSLIAQYYNQHYWQKTGNQKRFMVNILYTFRMLGLVKKIQKLIPKNGTVLDWGCGDGLFLELLRHNGLDSYGIDAYSNEQDRNYIFKTDIDSTPFPDSQFDAISCLHVLEHIVDIKESMKHAVRLLRAGGILVIEVPNIDSISFKIFKKRWQPLEIPTHINHFTPKTLKKMLADIETLKLIKIEYFSHRISSSSIVLSMFPFFSPRNIRAAHAGRYPLLQMLSYLLFQIITYPFAIIESLLRHGAVARIYVRKIN